MNYHCMWVMRFAICIAINLIWLDLIWLENTIKSWTFCHDINELTAFAQLKEIHYCQMEGITMTLFGIYDYVELRREENNKIPTAPWFVIATHVAGCNSNASMYRRWFIPGTTSSQAAGSQRQYAGFTGTRIWKREADDHLWPLLVTWINFNPSMVKWLHPL